EAGLPVVFGHLGARGGEPADVAHLAAAERPSLEPASAGEDWMRRAQPDQIAREAEQRAVGVLPVVPGDLVVLAVGVVVPLLRAADLVAAAQHRDPLRQEQRR